MKALLVRLSAIGDVVHTLPVAGRAARARAARWTGWWSRAARPLLEGNPARHPGHRRARRRAPSGLARGAAPPRASCGATRLRRGPRPAGPVEVRGLGARSPARGAWSASRGPGGASRCPRCCSASASPLAAGAAPRHRQEPGPAARRSASTPWAARVPAAAGARASRGASRERSPRAGWGDFAILNPGGGWASKLWPAERFGAVAQGLRERGLVAARDLGARARRRWPTAWWPRRRAPRAAASRRRCSSSSSWRGARAWWWPRTPGRCTSPARWARRWSASSAPPTPRATGRSRADDVTVRRQPAVRAVPPPALLASTRA